MAKTYAKEEPVAKKLATAANKSIVIEEVVISSSDESDFDGDPNSVVSGKHLKTISNIGNTTMWKAGGPSVITPKREGMMKQPDMVRGVPGASPFAVSPGIKQQSASNVKQEATKMARASASGVPIQTTPRLSKAQAKIAALQTTPRLSKAQAKIAALQTTPRLSKAQAKIAALQATPRLSKAQAKIAALQSVSAVSGSVNKRAKKSRAPSASSVGQEDLFRQQLQNIQQSFTPSAMQKINELLQSRGESSVTVPGVKKAAAAAAAAALLEEDNMEEEENMGVAETYAEYMPTKLKIGKQHPDPVVETASLSSVPPPDVRYKLSLPANTIDKFLLSALQLEAVTYACQQHDRTLPGGVRAGYLIGDGAGVGKGRTVSGIIFENYLQGRKRAIWVSISSDLKIDAERDLRDIGAGKIKVYPLNKMKYAKISTDINGDVKKGVIFSTYSSLIGVSQSGMYKTRLKQLLEWCGEDFDGVIVFDECHRAKNLVPSGKMKATKTGLAVLELQNKLPKARIVYASATGASEPRNMAYMVRLGLWGEETPFREFKDFLKAIEKRGVGAMEMVAMEMKLRGMYIARQLSFKDVTFQVEEVSLPPKFIKMYDDSVKLWVQLFQSFTEGMKLMKFDKKSCLAIWCQFWSAHQRFFKYLCIAAKVKHAVKVASDAVKSGKCVVIGLQSTGEARTLEQIENEGELSDFVSTAKGVLQSLVEKQFPAPSSYNGGTSSGKRKATEEAAERTKKRPRAANLDSEEESSEEINDETFEDFDFEVECDESGDYSEDLEDDDFNQFGGDDSDIEDFRHRSSTNAANPKKEKKKPFIPVKAKKVTSFYDFESEDETIQPKKNDGFKSSGSNGQPSLADLNAATRLKDEMLAQIEQLGAQLPPNTLDQLIDELGGPDNVAEMTGRKGRVVQNDNGKVEYVSRSELDIPLEILNIKEKERFMAGEKDVAIISEAASSGISLQADRRVENQRKRVHVTLELPWSADRAIQQFGRTHRSNQVSAPEYVFLISDLAGERRFASIVAKRLESLGALTHGDRRATETRDLSQFHIDNKYGREALGAIMQAVIGSEAAVVPPPADYKGDFFKDLTEALIGVGLIFKTEMNPDDLFLPKDHQNIRKFLNRILGMPVDLQNRLFHYFTETLAAIVMAAKKSGRYDRGILDLGTEEAKIYRTHLNTFQTGTGKIELQSFDVERGMSWDEAKSKWSLLYECPHEGFYMTYDNRFLNVKPSPTLVVQGTVARRGADKGEKLYTIIRPNSGYQPRQESLAEIKKKGRKLQPDQVEPHWNALFNATKAECLHAFQSGKCRQATLGIRCQYGLRKQTYNVLTGSVLSVWTKVESVLSHHHVAKMQVVRLRCGGMRIVGTVVPHSCMADIVNILTEEADTVSEQTFPQV